MGISQYLSHPAGLSAHNIPRSQSRFLVNFVRSNGLFGSGDKTDARWISSIAKFCGACGNDVSLLCRFVTIAKVYFAGLSFFQKPFNFQADEFSDHFQIAV